MGARYWELDFARGFAVVLMLAFNWQYALAFFGLTAFNASSGFWWWFARFVMFLFVFVSGASMWVSYSRAKSGLFGKFFKRGVFLFSLGVLVTIATYLFVPKQFVLFGVLHLLALSTVLAFPIAEWGWRKLAVLSLAVVSIGWLIVGATADCGCLIWFGLPPTGFQSLDYVPLLPWFGVFLLGLAFSKQAKFSISAPLPAKPFCFIGRYSLLIYLLHIPFLLAVLYALGKGVYIFG
ncbi:MAG: heparan-alpha-glucosaminide N-acetyltransferase [Candidatus Micrarchaeota archaeon]